MFFKITFYLFFFPSILNLQILSNISQKRYAWYNNINQILVSVKIFWWSKKKNSPLENEAILLKVLQTRSVKTKKENVNTFIFFVSGDLKNINRFKFCKKLMLYNINICPQVDVNIAFTCMIWNSFCSKNYSRVVIVIMQVLVTWWIRGRFGKKYLTFRRRAFLSGQNINAYKCLNKKANIY